MQNPRNLKPVVDAWRKTRRIGVCWVVAVVGVMAFTGCRDIKTPHTDIPRQQMKAILMDLYIAEQGAVYASTDAAKRDSLARIYYHAVLQHHGISPEDFQPVYEEYQRFPEFMSELNNEIADDLSQELGDPRYRNTQGTPPATQGPDAIRRPTAPGVPGSSAMRGQ